LSLTPTADDVGRFFPRLAQSARRRQTGERHLCPAYGASAASEQRRRARHRPNELEISRLETARAPNPVTNVRSDQIKAKPFWRDSLPKRRCLVPASSFCQPNGAVQPAPWRRFETKRPLYLSGVWRRCRVIHQAM